VTDYNDEKILAIVGRVAKSKPAQGSTADYCSTWPDDSHSICVHFLAATSISIRRCTSCGWIDGADIERQVEERVRR